MDRPGGHEQYLLSPDAYGSAMIQSAYDKTLLLIEVDDLCH